MKNFDVITFGSASQDIFVNLKNLSKAKRICFELGQKVDIDNIIVKSGGGGTNAAATFSLQGLKTAFWGTIGRDWAGGIVLEDIDRFKIEPNFIEIQDKMPTNYSVILSEQAKGRTILVYRGASNLALQNFGKPLKTKWFYLAPLAGQMVKLTQQIINFAKQHKIKIAINPSKEQLDWARHHPGYFQNIDVLLLNLEEASYFTGLSLKNEKEIIKKLKTTTKGIIVITKGSQGSIVLTNKHIYHAGILNTPVIDRTGAGDSFGAGFVCGLIKYNDVVAAIQLATANSASCLTKWGAKEGLLKKGQVYKKIKVTKEVIK